MFITLLNMTWVATNYVGVQQSRKTFTVTVEWSPCLAMSILFYNS